VPSVTSTSLAMTPPTHRRMISPSARQATSPAFASWASSRDTLESSSSNVSYHSSPESLSIGVVELENALCNQDKLLCKIFCENKTLNLELESASSKIATRRSAHDDMSAKTCNNCKIIMVNYADLWLVHSHVTSLLDGAIVELRELKAHSTLLGA
jgi:hypothetical protein